MTSKLAYLFTTIFNFFYVGSCTCVFLFLYFSLLHYIFELVVI